jgi:ABC-type transporter Mla MlaB component
MTPPELSTIAFAISGPIEPSDLPGLLERVCSLLEGRDVKVALCDLSDAEADAVTVDALARLRLAAKRNDCQVRLQHASSELRALAALMGLQDVLED